MLFNPAHLFLNTWEQPERDYIRKLSGKLRETGGYDRVVEPYVSAFVLPSIHIASGWKGSDLETSDVSLYSAIVGSVCTDRPLDQLGVKLDGEAIDVTGDRFMAGARLLHTQVSLRLALKPDVVYWNELRHDLAERSEAHIVRLSTYLRGLAERCQGMTFAPVDCWLHLDGVREDSRVIVTMNPPNSSSALDTFFDTGGRLTWDAPASVGFDPALDHRRLSEMAKQWACLLLVQQRSAPERGVDTVVHARDQSRGHSVYIWSNKPEVVFPLLPLSAVARNVTNQTPLPFPTIDPAEPIGPDSTIAIRKVLGREARYYKDLWLHRLDFASGGYDFGVFVNGKLAGLSAYSGSALNRPYSDGLDEDLILMYAIGAPHALRLTRLVTTIALSREAVETVLNPWTAARAKRMVTVEYTRHAESKTQRGLMKLSQRAPDPKYGRKLVYRADFGTTIAEAFETWRKREVRWQKQKPAG